MSELPDDTIDLIISGPPYWSFIDYSAFNRKEDYLWVDDTPYEAYLSKLAKWHTECYRVLKPGRYCVVNLATMMKGRKTYPIPFHAVAILEKLGFAFCYEIVWHKVSGGRLRARNFVQRPMPGSFTPNIRTEYLLVFRKKPSVTFKRWIDSTKKSASLLELDDFFYRETANNVWHVPPEGKNSTTDHPCPFPPEIPRRLISLFSLPGETVLDPFMGIGTTASIAKELGRHFVGYEAEATFIEKALKRLESPLPKKPRLSCFYDSERGQTTG